MEVKTVLKIANKKQDLFQTGFMSANKLEVVLFLRQPLPSTKDARLFLIA
jgi:hypothetical protein